MEDKNLKTPVFVMDTAYSNSAEIPIDVDFTLPDYCPDVNKILKCRAVSRISSKLCSGSSATVDGCVTITVIYCSSENRIFAYEYQYPFNKSFDTGCDTTGATLKVKTKTEYINCRAVTGRKIDIHGAAGVYLKLCKRKCTDIISDVDDINIELRRTTAKATSPMGSAEKYLILEEELEIGQGQPSIATVLRYDAAASVKECKLINNKTMVKGELAIKILYIPEQGEPQMLTDTLAFSQLLEIEGITDDCECEAAAHIANIELKPRISASGDVRTFMLNCKLLVSCDCCCNNDIDVVLDAYSRKYEASISHSDICFNKINRNINETFSCKKSITVSETDIVSVADVWCDAKCDDVRCEKEELIISGVVTASFIIINSNGEPVFFEKSIDFEYKKPLDLPSEKVGCNPQITVSSCGYTITGNNGIELYAELCINAAVYTKENMKLITDVNINEKNPIKKHNNGAMTVYFANEGENIWDIARHYLASVEEIKTINDIESDVLAFERMILVPMN